LPKGHFKCGAPPVTLILQGGSVLNQDIQMRSGIPQVAFSLLLTVAALEAGAEGTPPTETERASQSRKLSQEYAARLKSTLMGAIQAGGPEAAIAVCKVKAPAIAKEKAASTGWSIGRTALKLRNPANSPDAWERSVLLRFQDQISDGTEAKNLEHYETTTKNSERVFRYMRAIPTQAPCLTCHGSNLSQNVKAKIEELYPEDRATGFSHGELRGAFTIVQPLP
jgi:hypothetical protein